ncbi:hypothetical protein VTK73DRAFT_1810 [Phialemonium thermophilum]|uniref:DUF8035 domain-containing protein n=1 Tax=Phialemonium thermophilum TaxID=223376 RepID=A0ABR3X8K0_9PEZI
MAYRNSGTRISEVEERDTYYDNIPPPRRPPPPNEVDIYERREERQRRSSPPRRAPVREYEDVDVRVRERERDRESRVPAFLREEPRRTGAGPLVLRQRDVETVERERRRSPSPVRVRETRIVERARSVSPPPPPRREVIERDDVRVRTVERERIRSPSRGPPMERVRTRFIERERSPSPVERETDRIRIVRRERERSPTPSPSPSPPPPVIRGPTIEREVITHYRDIDHGIVPARPPSPPPPRMHRDSEIDIYTSRHATEVDIHQHSHSRSRGRERSRSHERPSPRRPPPPRAYDDEVIVHSDRNHLSVDIEEHRRSASRTGGHRRAHSALPPAEHLHHHWDDDEAEYITSRIDSRGRVGEAWHGATKDWVIVDVPPGTERVRMEGVGGGAAEVKWEKYSGARRSRFIPERDPAALPPPPVPETRDPVRNSERETRLSVQIYDENGGRDREREVDVEKVTDRRVVSRNPRRTEMWTEITKDLVIREAIEDLGYEYEETESYFYIMQYLRYEDVLEIVQRSDDIRRARRDRIRELQWDREVRKEYDYEWEWDSDRHSRRRHRHHHGHGHGRYDDERVVETEVVYDSRGPARLR